MWVSVVLPLGHTATAKFQPHPGALLTAKESEAIAESLTSLGSTLDACATGADHDVDDLTADVVLPKDGAFDSVTLSRSTQQVEIDRCAISALLAAEMPTLGAKVKGVVFVDFLEPAAPAADSATLTAGR
jgi:hypothetical protein